MHDAKVRVLLSQTRQQRTVIASQAGEEAQVHMPRGAPSRCVGCHIGAAIVCQGLQGGTEADVAMGARRLDQMARSWENMCFDTTGPACAAQSFT